MRAFVINKYAHPSKIPLSIDVPEPKPGVDEVLVDVYSAGLNFYDVSVSDARDFRLFNFTLLKKTLFRFSKLKGNIKLVANGICVEVRSLTWMLCPQNQPPFPFALGSEFSGQINANSPIPKGCPFKPGDRIFGYVQGAYAERVAVSWKNLTALPSNLSYDQGAGESQVCSQIMVKVLSEIRPSRNMAD